METLMNEVLDQVDEIYLDELSVHFEVVQYQKMEHITAKPNMTALVHEFQDKMQLHYWDVDRDLAFIYTGYDYSDSNYGGTFVSPEDYMVSRLSDYDGLAYSAGMMVNGSDGIPDTLLERTIIMAHEIGHQFSPYPGDPPNIDHIQGVRWNVTDQYYQTIMHTYSHEIDLELLPIFSNGTLPPGDPNPNKNNRERFLWSAPRYLPDSE